MTSGPLRNFQLPQLTKDQVKKILFQAFDNVDAFEYTRITKSEGFFNPIYIITIGESKYVLKQGNPFWGHAKITAEAVTMALFSEHVDGVPVPSIYGHGECDGILYIIMDYIEGAVDILEVIKGPFKRTTIDDLAKMMVHWRRGLHIVNSPSAGSVKDYIVVEKASSSNVSIHMDIMPDVDSNMGPWPSLLEYTRDMIKFRMDGIANGPLHDQDPDYYDQIHRILAGILKIYSEDSQLTRELQNVTPISTVMHGDLENTLVDPTNGKIKAVIDWEWAMISCSDPDAISIADMMETKEDMNYFESRLQHWDSSLYPDAVGAVLHVSTGDTSSAQYWASKICEESMRWTSFHDWIVQEPKAKQDDYFQNKIWTQVKKVAQHFNVPVVGIQTRFGKAEV